jgi:DNA polymerase III delta subunit
MQNEVAKNRSPELFRTQRLMKVSDANEAPDCEKELKHSYKLQNKPKHLLGERTPLNIESSAASRHRLSTSSNRASD